MKQNKRKLFFLFLSLTMAMVLQAQETIDDPVEIGELTGEYCFLAPFSDSRNTCNYTNDGAGANAPDVWYSFTLNAEADISISMCGSSYDTYLYLYDSDQNQIASNDDYFGCPDGLHSQIDMTLDIGTYFFACDGYSSSCGVYNLEVYGAPTTPVPPVPDMATLPDLASDCAIQLITPPTARDACDNTVFGTPDQLIYGATGTHVATWTYDDGAGGISTQTQNLTINDVPITPPVPVNGTLPDVNEDCMATVTEIPTALDACSNVIEGATTDPLIYTLPGTYTITWSYNDLRGNIVTQPQTVIVNADDNSAPVPVVDPLPDLTGPQCYGFVSSTPTAIDNCAGLIIGTTTDPTFYWDQGIHTITWIYDDGAGHITTQTQNVIVEDVSNPTISCPTVTPVGNIAGECYAVVTYDFPLASDNCGISTVELTSGLGSGANFPVGDNVETYTATDVGGNTATCSFTVQVLDQENPTIDCPEDIAVSNDEGVCGAIVSYPTPIGSDDCTEVTVSLTSGPASGELFPVGTTVVTYTATDLGGNTASCSFNVTVEDTEAPTIACDDVTANNDEGECGAIVAYTAPVGTDNCAGASTVFFEGLGSGALFPLGTSVETYVVTDAVGLTDTCRFNVIVVDVTDPEIICPTVSPTWNWAGECFAEVTYALPIATDNCGDVVVSLTSGLGSGAEFPVGNNVETYTATDNAGNTATCAFTVQIWDQEDPIIDCPDDITVSNDVGVCGAVVTYTTPVASDNCGEVTVSLTSGPASGDLFPLGTTVVTYTATDQIDNTATCSFNVTVEDTEAPTITCDDITVNNSEGECGAIVTYTAPVGIDNCEGASTVLFEGLGSGILFPVGTSIETYVVTDAAGLTDTCRFNVIVVDAEAPTIDCAADISVSNDVGTCGAIVSYAAPEAIDNCAVTGTEMTAGLASGETFPIGVTTVTYTATDEAGNSNSCSFTVTVSDTEDPVITCPNAITICEGTQTDLAPVVSDNCETDVTYVLTGATTGTGDDAAISADLAVGETTVEYTVTDLAGNTATCSFVVTVEAAFEETITEEICDGESYTLLDGTQVTEAGLYPIVYASANGCDSTFIVDLTIITVNTATTDDGTTITASATGAAYQWKDCGNSNADIDGETGQSYTPVESGSYAVGVTENGCADVSDCVTITLVNGLDDESISGILAYPNPVVDNITVDLGKIHSSLTVNIMNLEGQLIYEFKETNSQILNYDMQDLHSGTYMIRIKSDEGTALLSFIKK